MLVINRFNPPRAHSLRVNSFASSSTVYTRTHIEIRTADTHIHLYDTRSVSGDCSSIAPCAHSLDRANRVRRARSPPTTKSEIFRTRVAKNMRCESRCRSVRCCRRRWFDCVFCWWFFLLVCGLSFRRHWRYLSISCLRLVFRSVKNRERDCLNCGVCDLTAICCWTLMWRQPGATVALLPRRTAGKVRFGRQHREFDSIQVHDQQQHNLVSVLCCFKHSFYWLRVLQNNLWP